MKVKIWDIVNDGSCGIDTATDRVMRMRRNDAATIAFIIRKIIFNGNYDPLNLTISFDENFVIPEITYDDMVTISRFMSKKPYNHGFEGIAKITTKMEDIMRWKEEHKDEEGGEQ